MIAPYSKLVVILTLATWTSSYAQLAISFNYSLDTSGFFTAERRNVLDSAASVFTSRITDTLSAITPGGFNSWDAEFTHPSTGNNASLHNLSIPANTLTIYVGARALGSDLAYGEFGGYSWTGTGSWGTTVSTRGQTGAPNTEFGPWGGAISFNSGTSWYFDSDPLTTADIPSNQYDFWSLAVHELGHVLGFGAATSFLNLTSGASFTGSHATSVYGSNVPLESDQKHWKNNTVYSTIPGTSTFQETAMDPLIALGARKYMTTLDFAALQDVGWTVTPVPEPRAAILATCLGLSGLALCRRTRPPA